MVKMTQMLVSQLKCLGSNSGCTSKLVSHHLAPWEEVGDGSDSWVPATHMVDLDFHAAFVQAGPVLEVAGTFGINT